MLCTGKRSPGSSPALSPEGDDHHGEKTYPYLRGSSKTGMQNLPENLLLGWELLSSSGTANHLRKAALTVTKVSDITGYPHILGGQVKACIRSLQEAFLRDRRTQPLKDTGEYSIPSST